jgi:hypothetical protein
VESGKKMQLTYPGKANEFMYSFAPSILTGSSRSTSLSSSSAMPCVGMDGSARLASGDFA